MTTHYIQTLGVAKCREILSRSSFGSHYRIDTDEVICCHNETHFYFQDQVEMGVEFIRLDDLRAELSAHDTDSCTDIRNHLSPNTVVLENNLQEQFQEANEAGEGR